MRGSRPHVLPGARALAAQSPMIVKVGARRHPQDRVSAQLCLAQNHIPMFAVINRLTFTKPVDELAEDLRATGLPLLSAQPGFKTFHFVREDDRTAIVVLLWSDGASAQAGAQSFGPAWFATHLKPFLAAAEDRHVGPVTVSSAG